MSGAESVNVVPLGACHLPDEPVVKVGSEACVLASLQPEQTVVGAAPVDMKHMVWGVPVEVPLTTKLSAGSNVG
jgi:hypothetical protein